VKGTPEDGPTTMFFDPYSLTENFLSFIQNIVQIKPPFSVEIRPLIFLPGGSVHGLPEERRMLDSESLLG
jgi:hypothetical protein